MFELKDIFVKYSYKSVLNGISLKFEQEKIYSLLGENGAGKSTLAHVICGDINQTSGKIILNNKEVYFDSPKKAIENGICCVHQRPLLAQEISIYENLKIGVKKINKQRQKELLDFWLPGISEKTIVKELGMENQFYVSLTGALLKNPQILILDEPPRIEKGKLKSLLTRYNCHTIIVITHDLNEAINKTDFTILLQEGKILKACPTRETSAEEIENLLFGISEKIEFPSDFIQANLDENLFFQNKNKKIAYIPSDKTFRASNPNLTIMQLLCSRRTNLKKSDAVDFSNQLLKKAEVNIKLKEKVSALSGGMLQRLILEKELAEHPETIVLFNPLHGLDADASKRLFSKLKNLAQNGVKVIINS